MGFTERNGAFVGFKRFQIFIFRLAGPAIVLPPLTHELLLHLGCVMVLGTHLSNDIM